MGLWRNWNILNLARNQKKKRWKERKNMEAHISSSQTNSTSLFYSSIFLQLLLTVYFYLTSFLSAWQPGQRRLVWKAKKQTWWLLVFLEVFSPCWHLQCDLALFYEEVFPMNRTQRVQTALCNVCHLFQVRTVEKQTEVYSRDPDCLAKHSLSCTTQNSSTFLRFVSPQSCILSLTCPRFALFCLKSRLSNYQRLACRVVPLDWVISTDCFPWDSAE